MFVLSKVENETPTIFFVVVISRTVGVLPESQKVVRLGWEENNE